MAAGIKSGRVQITSSQQALGPTLFDGVTYSYARFRCAGGSICWGPTGLSGSSASVLSHNEEVIEVTLTAADLFFIGNGTLDFFGIATA
jgi:hypothetical protein